MYTCALTPIPIQTNSSFLNLFSSYKSYPECFRVQLLNHTTVSITYVGTIIFFSLDFKLDNVFSIPSFKFNLLPISQLTKLHSYWVTFFLIIVSYETFTRRRRVEWVKLMIALLFSAFQQFYSLPPPYQISIFSIGDLGIHLWTVWKLWLNIIHLFQVCMIMFVIFVL